MKRLLHLFLLPIAALGLVILFPHQAQAGTIQHKFLIELPNGDVEQLSGGPVIHSVYKDNDTELVTEYCMYPGKGGDDTEHMERLTDGYSCVTPSGCDWATWHSPIFPAGFDKPVNYYARVRLDGTDNPNIRIVETTHATFASDQTFTQKYPWAAQYFDANDPLGGSTFYWQGHVDDHGEGSFYIVDGGKPSQVNQSDVTVQSGSVEDYLNRIDSLWNTVYWRKYDGNNPAGKDDDRNSYQTKNVSNWNDGSILFNSVGHNVLHGSVTWTLKNNIPSQSELSCQKIGTTGKPAWDPNKVSIGQTVSFWCMAVDGADSYEFRVIEPGGNIVSLDKNQNATGILPTQVTSAGYKVEKAGTYTAQCRVCQGNDCTAWGAAGQN